MSAIVSPATVHMPLSSAFLCSDCHCIGNCSRQCPACASGVLLSLAAVLDREIAVAPAFQWGLPASGAAADGL